MLLAGPAWADPLVERIVDELEASPGGCGAVPSHHPQRRLIEADVAAFVQIAPIPPGVHFEVLDCFADGFVYRGRTVVLSTRLARLSPPQRFFIMAHELGHLHLAHRAAMNSFVSNIVSKTRDEQAARAKLASGLAAHSHQAELDADAFAVRLMRDAGHDPEQAARLFDSIGQNRDTATHPSSRRRARSIRSLL
jgi:Zn-dependent protease with chaperone function